MCLSLILFHKLFRFLFLFALNLKKAPIRKTLKIKNNFALNQLPTRVHFSSSFLFVFRNLRWKFSSQNGFLNATKVEMEIYSSLMSMKSSGKMKNLRNGSGLKSIYSRLRQTMRISKLLNIKILINDWIRIKKIHYQLS